MRKRSSVPLNSDLGHVRHFAIMPHLTRHNAVQCSTSTPGPVTAAGARSLESAYQTWRPSTLRSGSKYTRTPQRTGRPCNAPTHRPSPPRRRESKRSPHHDKDDITQETGNEPPSHPPTPHTALPLTTTAGCTASCTLAGCSRGQTRRPPAGMSHGHPAPP